jgi:hypothetical protein
VLARPAGAQHDATKVVRLWSDVVSLAAKTMTIDFEFVDRLALQRSSRFLPSQFGLVLVN